MKKPIELTWEIFTGDKWDCIVQFGKYTNNDRTSIELTDKHTGEPVMTCTSNLPRAPLKEDEVAIKNYSENEGILQKLIDAGVVSKPLGYAPSGYVRLPVCKLLVDPEDYE